MCRWRSERARPARRPARAAPLYPPAIWRTNSEIIPHFLSRLRPESRSWTTILFRLGCWTMLSAHYPRLPAFRTLAFLSFVLKVSLADLQSSHLWSRYTIFLEYITVKSNLCLSGSMPVLSKEKKGEERNLVISIHSKCQSVEIYWNPLILSQNRDIDSLQWLDFDWESVDFHWFKFRA